MNDETNKQHKLCKLYIELLKEHMRNEHNKGLHEFKKDIDGLEFHFRITPTSVWGFEGVTIEKDLEDHRLVEYGFKGISFERHRFWKEESGKINVSEFGFATLYKGTDEFLKIRTEGIITFEHAKELLFSAVQVIKEIVTKDGLDW